MKVTTKTVKTLQLERKQVDKALVKNMLIAIKDAADCEDMEAVAVQAAYYSEILKHAWKGEYSKIAANGDTMFMLNDEEMELVDNHFYKQRIGENIGIELNIEIVDGEVFIDKIVEDNIQY